MQFIPAEYFVTPSIPLIIRCPHCGHNGSFSPIHSLSPQRYIEIKIQYCPSPDCQGIVMATISHGELIDLYPPIIKPINTDNVPAGITAAFEEAVSCDSHGNYISAAIMLRRTLEEICEDKKSEGANLHQRIQHLCDTTMMPQPLKEAMKELKLLGNDATHIHSKDFKNIGPKELEISIEFTQEIIKAVYQYDNLLTKLQSLKIGSTVSQNPQ